MIPRTKTLGISFSSVTENQTVQSAKIKQSNQLTKQACMRTISLSSLLQVYCFVLNLRFPTFKKDSLQLLFQTVA